MTMGKVTTFRIVVDNGNTVTTGDTITGQVRLHLREDLKANEVRISFSGLSGTQWAEAQKSGSIPEMNTAVVDPVVAEEIYFSHSLTLWRQGGDSADSATTSPARESTTLLRKGAHTMDFEFHVPESCPSSFSGGNGYVQYQLKAVIEKPTRKRVREVLVTTLALKVTSQLDLNDVYEARDSVDVSRDLQINKLLLPSIDCHATLRLARKGFTQGETIPVEFSVHNNSSNAVQNVSLLLKMIILYKAGDRRCESECILDRRALGTVPARKTLQGLDKQLRVPVTCPPTGLPGCNLIDVKYRVELKVRPTAFSLKRLHLCSDVIVGTTPLGPSSYRDSPPDYWSCCLPSYEEVMAFTLPPSYSQSPPSPGSSSPVFIHVHPPSAVTPQDGSLPPSADNSPRFTKNTPEAVLRQNVYPAICSD